MPPQGAQLLVLRIARYFENNRSPACAKGKDQFSIAVGKSWLDRFASLYISARAELKE